MFRAFFTFDTPAVVLATEARLGFFLGIIISILSTFVDKFKINFPGKERVPWERACTVLIYTHPQDHLRFQDGERAVYSDSLVIVGHEMIDDLPDPRPIEEKQNTRKNGSCESQGSHHGSLACRFSRPFYTLGGETEN